MGAEHSKHGGADPTQVAALHEHRRQQQQQQQHHRLHPLHVPPQPAQPQHDELHLPRIQLTSPSPSTIQRHVTLRVLPLPTPPPPPLATPRTSGAPPAHKEATTATTATPPRPRPHDKVLLRCGAFRACGLTASPPAACLSASTHTHGSVASHTTSSTSTHATRPAKTPHTSRLPTSRSLTPVCTTCDTATARASDTQTRAHTHTRNDSRTHQHHQHQHHDDKKTKKSNNSNKSGSSNKSSSNKSSRGSTSHGARSDIGAAGERSTQPPRPLPAVTMAAAAAERAAQSWHKAVDWVAVTEAALVMDWCARRLVRSSPAAAAAMTTTSSISSSALVSAPATSAAAATQASAKRHEQATASGTATASAAATPTAAGADVQVPLNCDAVPFPYNRTTCVVYKPCNAAHDRNGGAALTAPCSSHVGAAAVGGMYANALPVELPVGEAYYNALCAAWRQPATGVAGNNSSGRGEAALALPPVADEDDLDDSLILESIEDAVSCEFSPAIPLQHMITLLVPEWEEEGLYEDLQ